MKKRIKIKKNSYNMYCRIQESKKLSEVSKMELCKMLFEECPLSEIEELIEVLEIIESSEVLRSNEIKYICAG